MNAGINSSFEGDFNSEGKAKRFLGNGDEGKRKEVKIVRGKWVEFEEENGWVFFRAFEEEEEEE